MANAINYRGLMKFSVASQRESNSQMLYSSRLKIEVFMFYQPGTLSISPVKSWFKNSDRRLDEIGLLAALRSKPFQSAPGRFQFDPILT